MKVIKATNDQDLSAIADTLLVLRPKYTKSEIIEQIQVQQAEGYQLAYVEFESRVIAVAGFVISNKLAWGKHIYVDDLVTLAEHRSSGAGGALIDWLKEYGKQQGCIELHLDSGVQRFAAHRFYLRHGFDITSHHFQLTL